MSHLLVTNDFPPKVGGIQTYLWELWRRLDPSSFAVLTTDWPGSEAFDARAAEMGIRIERLPQRMLLPTPELGRRIEAAVRSTGASLVVLDPALPVGRLGESLPVPYAVVLHGAEVTVPARLPAVRDALRRVVAGASLVVAAGGYPANEARRLVGEVTPPVAEVPPGIDPGNERPFGEEERLQARRALGVDPDAPLVVSVSRLVPRKGMDVLIRASARLLPSFPGLRVLVAGTGRDMARLQRLAEGLGAPVRLLGSVSDDERSALLGAADVFVMACRNRWAGWEQEGFGIVFLEAAAVGVPQVAGRSGGAHEAVEHGVTGLVVDRPLDAGAVALAVRQLLSDPDRRRRMGEAARARAERCFALDHLADRLAEALAQVGG